MDGSSPPARGTRVDGDRGTALQRFIPARAGNTSLYTSSSISSAVHPRPRGEHTSRMKVLSSGTGSSPPARGTRRINRRVLAVQRFIPARAGNTGAGPGRSDSESVHPRPRGEHPAIQQNAHRYDGSSPPARGTPEARRSCRLNGRFIPARAGNTHPRACSPEHSAVHPRPRGEHGIHCGRFQPYRRFIPARAGNTMRRANRLTRDTVHPRPRGEHNALMLNAPSVHGSSPPARGTRSDAGRNAGQFRFIPARAGNTPHRSQYDSVIPVHPRPRGEHMAADRMVEHMFGSSPPARGTRTDG